MNEWPGKEFILASPNIPLALLIYSVKKMNILHLAPSPLPSNKKDNLLNSNKKIP